MNANAALAITIAALPLTVAGIRVFIESVLYFDECSEFRHPIVSQSVAVIGGLGIVIAAALGVAAIWNAAGVRP